MQESDFKSNDVPPAATKRVSYRLHRSTYCVLAACLLIAIIVIIPGEDGTFRDCDENDGCYGMRSFIHGWPLWFVRRRPTCSWDDPLASSTYAWEITDSVDEFRLGALFVDGAIVMACLSVIVALIERRRRRRRHQSFQFSLRQAFIVVTLAAVGCGLWARQYKLDQELCARLASVNSQLPSVWAITSDPRLPIWLRKLVGDDALARLGFNLPRETTLDWNRSQHENIQYLVARFPGQFTLRTKGPLSDDDIALIMGMVELQSVQISGATDELLQRLSRLTNLTELTITKEQGLSPASWSALSKMPRLKHLSIDCFDGASELDLAGMEALTNIEELAISYSRINPGAIGHLAALGQLQRLTLNDTVFRFEDLRLLRPLLRLVKLNLRRTSISDAELPVLTALSGLRVVYLDETQVSETGLEFLHKISPDLDCFADNPDDERQRLKAAIAEVAGSRSDALEVVGCMLKDGDVSGLGDLEGLKCLRIRARYLGDQAFRQIVRLSSVETLDVENTGITAHALCGLAEMTALQDLKLNARQIDKGVVEALKKLPALRALRLHQIDDSTIPDDFMKNLQENLPNCDCIYEPSR